jgi:uncharacterized protein YjbJ (UPF0337 family)
MGLLDARNIKKAKGLLEKNRHKVGDLVGKATDQVDKISKGKTASVTSKIDDAARKFSGDTDAVTGSGADVGTDADETAGSDDSK